MRRTWLKMAMALALSICGTRAQAVVFAVVGRSKRRDLRRLDDSDL